MDNRRAVELLMEPARAERLGIGLQFVAFTPFLEGRNRGFGGQHAGLDCGVAALDARRVEEAGFVADQRSAGEDELRQGLQAAGGYCPRSIGHADRKSTRLNSSHLVISYAVFCLKKKKKIYIFFSFRKKKKKKQ